MPSRSIVRILLSLLLLMSQQMAIAHVLSHAGSARAQALRLHDTGTSELSKAFAQDQSCDQCLSFAQIASALSDTRRAFAGPENTFSALASVASQAACARTDCGFQSRAPPLSA